VPIPENYSTTQRTQRIRLVEILLFLSRLCHEEEKCPIFPSIILVRDPTDRRRGGGVERLD
jgi:hypothetical protein